MTIPDLRKITERFSRKNEAVLNAAATLFNAQGLKGVSLADVARQVGLETTSLTYYFRRKEDLAAACLLRSVRAVDAIATAAQDSPTSAARVTAFVRGYMRLLGGIAARECPELINFHDMRALTGPQATEVFRAYEDLFRRVRSLLSDPSGPRLPRVDANARAHLLLAITTDAQNWLSRYESDDYDRAALQTVDVLLSGLGAAGSTWAPPAFPADQSRPVLGPEANGRDAFFRAATELVNEQGYHGASVVRISARLNVTKGSFYHHLDSKDELISSCFERSCAVVRRAQRAAIALPERGWSRVSSAADALVRYQLSAHGPLLRYRALNAVPYAVRAEMLAAKGRLAERFAGMVFDGIADGSVRAVDPVVAGQLVDAMINAVANLPRWVPAATEANVSALFARPLFEGLDRCPPVGELAGHL